jgi:Papain-like cysteine protease AvrRpt2
MPGPGLAFKPATSMQSKMSYQPQIADRLREATSKLQQVPATSVLKPIANLSTVPDFGPSAMQEVVAKPELLAKMKLSAEDYGAIFRLLPMVSYVLPLGSSFKTAPQQGFAVSIRFTLSGDATPINFTYSGLPQGVTPVTSVVNFAGWSTRRIFLNFSVSDDAPLVDTQHFTIHYSAYNGLRQDDIPLTLTIWSGFPMQKQLESNWCWAATSTSVDHWYNPSSTVTQCQVVNAQLSRNDCCNNPGSSNCNVYGYLDQALSYLGRLDHMDSSSESYATIVGQVVSMHPLGIRVAWAGGGAHFIAATGHEQGNMVVIDDPIYGTSVVYYTTLFGTYQGSGNWTHSYFTKA